MTNEYISKQDATSIIEKEMKHYVSDIWYKSATHSALNDVNEDIKSLEPADVVPVVRCKDCKHHAYDEIFSCYWCEYPGRVRDTTPDGFCEKGEE